MPTPLEKKPSERINEIADELIESHKKSCNECGFNHHLPTRTHMFNDALLAFLDEEYERNEVITSSNDKEE